MLTTTRAQPARFGPRLLSIPAVLLAAACGPGLAQEPAGPSARLILKGHRDGIYSVAFSPNGKCLASASRDGTIKVWALDSGKEVHTLSGHQGQVLRLAY